jgi:hypothetical protein
MAAVPLPRRYASFDGDGGRDKPMAQLTLSAAQARRMALAAQGFSDPLPTGEPGVRALMRAISRTQLFQIDSVNVLTQAHYMPAFSRLGPYPRAALEAIAWGPKRQRRLFEYWGHAASLLPLDTEPLLRWRMAKAQAGEGTWGRMAVFAGERRGEAEALVRRIEAEGPLAASDLEAKGSGGWWGWSDAKTALEFLFWAGRITTATRRGGFERVYDLPERVFPAEILGTATPRAADAQRELVRRSARALGVATAGDLRDYFRLKPGEFAGHVEALVEAGELQPVAVEGWNRPAFLDPGAAQPRRAMRDALLAPFDPLVWRRERAERLFGFHYRIGIYTPEHQRTHGYYVLPFLMGDRIAARVDLKADRAAAALRVQSAHAEAKPREDLAGRLAANLTAMARWLGLERVEVRGRGDLSERLSDAVSRA